MADRGGLFRRTEVRFVAVGIANTLVDLVSYTVLRSWHVDVLLANFIATSLGMCLSFVLNRSFTFRSTGGSRSEVARQITGFVIVTGFGLWVIQPLVIFGSTWLFEAFGLRIVPPLDLLPKLCAICVGLVWNYVLYAKLVFRRPRRG
ncbi:MULTISPECIES: GtrA family protein [Agromyces]|uniref:Sugar translocase n=1 Tax=Agromyces mediolanus TaxID=41986 RepID=A0A918CQ29_AGRME|nr:MULTISPECIES: GtrA family protein [Agromyces]GGR34456.1 sugar translocase [Agromyces mediolanus]GLJ74113.1 sugar translocase [Agromyces mediolanus]GLU90647.1 sugar translocase [Agromyces sp. NBRC 114283]